ncbi:hypothetical protein Bca101_008674 [Brassica carinata]
MSTFSTVSELKPNNEICKINVQIIRLWYKYLAAGRHTIELVLCDHMGDKIHASISEDLAACYESRLKEGYWKILENFAVFFSRGAYRISQHACKIEFGVNTRVRVCDFFPRPLIGFQPVAFRDILDGYAPTEYLVGDDDRLTVHMWGKYAINFTDAIQNLNPDKYVICVLRFGKISVFRDRSVSTAYDVTDVRINPEMVEVECFLNLLNKHDPHIALVASKPVCMIPDIIDKYRFFRPIPKKSIRQVLETEQVERCIVMCTIAAIDYDTNWYYMSCKSCCHAVVSEPGDRMFYGNHIAQVSQKYYCLKCNTSRPQLLPRYNIKLVVMDNTSDRGYQL